MANASAGETEQHKAAVRDEFTRQAPVYATAAVITDAQRLARLVEAIDPRPGDRALEVATGPGHVAMALAARCGEVVGVDLTPAPLEIARRLSRERGIANVSFELGEADRLRFADGEFQIVVCRFAFHHFENPEAILGEMRRVCAPGGTIAIEDLFASEHPERARRYNHVERLRDSSHTRALAPSELIAMTARAGLEIERLYSLGGRVEAEPWLAAAQTPPEKAQEVRRLLNEDALRDLSGARPAIENGQLTFIQRTLAVVCRKL
ncbi:methyltransferase domain-containing protein [bacterium]|jgi:ubiquinone/menaquinone biosynthesis C-methylase UbiE|nr:methyltransferase domain-containing protein [bacterium]